MVFVGTANDEIGSVLVQRLMESSDEDLNNTASRFLCLGLGLVYLGKAENADVILEAVRTVVWHLRFILSAFNNYVCFSGAPSWTLR